MCFVFTDIEHQSQAFKFINGILWHDGIKYRRVTGFNKKNRVQYWICSYSNKYKNTKCECRAITKYVLKEGSDMEDIVNLNEIDITISDDMETYNSEIFEDITNHEGSVVDPRKSEQFTEVLVYGDTLEKHAIFHEVDKVELTVMEMKENMDFVMAKDPTLEPSTVYKAVLLECTEKLEGDLKNEVIAALEITKTEGHYRYVQ